MLSTMRRRRLPLIASTLATALMLATLCPCLGPSPGGARAETEHSCCAPETGLQAASPACCSMSMSQDHQAATTTDAPGLSVPVLTPTPPMAPRAAAPPASAATPVRRPPLLVPLRI